jgi:hypothetical protein
LAEGAFGVVEAGFHGAEGRAGDGGDIGEGKILDDVEDEDGAVRRGQFGEQGEDGFVLLGAENEVARVGRGIVGREGEFAPVAAEVLRAELVGDAEKPAGEAAVFAEAGEVLHGANEGGLHEVEAGGLVAHEFLDEGEKRELIAGEQDFLGAAVALVGGGDRAGETGPGIRRGGGGRHGGVKQSPSVECAGGEKVQSRGAAVTFPGTRAELAAGGGIDQCGVLAHQLVIGGFVTNVGVTAHEPGIVTHRVMPDYSRRTQNHTINRISSRRTTDCG